MLSVVWWIDFNFAGAVGGQIGFSAARGLCSVRIYFDLGADLCTSADSALCESDQCDSEKCALILSLAKLPYTLVMVVITAGAVVASVWTTTTLMFALPMWVLFRRIADRMAQFLYPAADLCDI